MACFLNDEPCPSTVLWLRQGTRLRLQAGITDRGHIPLLGAGPAPGFGGLSCWPPGSEPYKRKFMDLCGQDGLF